MEQAQALLLIVDADESTRRTRARILQQHDYRILEAETGRDAIEITQTHPPDLVLINTAIPGMNSQQVIQILKGNPETGHIPIILFDDDTQPAHVAECLDAGADECMSAAVTDQELIARANVLTAHKRVVNRVHEINEKLSDMIEEQTDRLELLYDLARELSAHDDLNLVLDATIKAAAKATGSFCISIMLQDRQDKRLYVAKAIGLDPRIQAETRITVGQGVSGKVFAERTLMVVKDDHQAGHSQRYETGAFASLPIQSSAQNAEKGPVGVLNVTDRPDGRPYTKEQLHCLQSIADNAAVAIQNQIRRQELDRARDATIFALAKLTESRDKDTGLHIERVQHYCRVLAEDLARTGPYGDQITREFIDDVYRSACLHDIGKIAVPDGVLLKPGRLTVDEYNIIKTHTTVGSETLAEVMSGADDHSFIRIAADIVRSHHEKYDGTGYPDGLVGDDIPLAARILALADVYDALTSERPYKKAADHVVAADIIYRSKGTHFDPNIVDAFERQETGFNEIRTKMADPSWAPIA